jgi:hypothetical protein
VLKRHDKRYVPGNAVTLLTALALGQQGHFASPQQCFGARKLDIDRAALA